MLPNQFHDNEFEQIFQATSNGMQILDLELNVIRTNKAFADMIGIGLKEIGDRRCFEVFSCPLTDTPNCCAKRILNGLSYVEEEIEVTRCNGKTAWFFHSATPLRDSEGRLTGIVQNFHDITDRKNAELAAIRANEEWEQTFDAMGDIVTIHDSKMRIMRANKAAGEILGLPLNQLYGKFCYSIFRAQNRPCDGCPEALAIHDYQTHTAEISHPGLNKTFLVSASPILNDQGVCTGVIHVAKDVTAFKAMEHKLRQSQKIEAIGTLAGGIAHDFNNVLTAILGYTDLVMRDITPESDLYEDLHQVRMAGLRAKNLVRQILTFSRQKDSEKVSLNPGPIIKEVIKFLRSTLPASIEIHQEIRNGAGMIFADPTMIYQVIMNLCVNASHAIGETSGTITVSLYRQLITEEDLSVYHELKQGPHLILSVADTGHGMENEILEHIFDPFFTTKDIDKGTGMGLAVVHGIVTEHKGTIRVKSMPGEGTTFQVFFPETQQETSMQPSIETPSPAGGNERILIVDDEEALGSLLCRVLEPLGYRITLQTGSVEALQLFRDNKDLFDLVLTDQSMPKMTGMEMAGEMLRIRPDLPIILCTGYSTRILQESIKEIGIRTILYKPLINTELTGCIRKVLSGTEIRKF